MSNSRVYRALQPGVQPRAGGLLGIGDDDGLFGDPFSGLPGLSGLSTALSPILTPIGLPGPGGKTRTTDTTTSATATATVSLTRSSSSPSATSATSNTSATATSTSTSTSATSDTSSSTSTSQTSSASQQTATSATQTPTPSPSVTTSASVSLPPSSSTSDTAAASGTPEAQGAQTVPKQNSFLANKALSVGVITAASLVGLVLIIAIATWAIRKRRNDRIHQDILDFSTAGLVNDEEKGSGGGSGGGRRDMFADGGVDNNSSNGHGSGSSSGHGAFSQPQVQPRGMYENSGYPTMPVFVPNQGRAMNQYPAQNAYNASGYAFPTQDSNNTYANWGYGYGNGAAPTQPNNFDQAYGGVEDAYGGIATSAPQSVMAGISAGAQSAGPQAQVQRRPSGHRKPPPQLYIPPANPIAQAVPTNAPSPVVASNAVRRTSLLNSPKVGGPEAPRERKDTLTHVEQLDPNAPRLPGVSAPLPDEFGVTSPPASKDAPPEQPVRRLVVRNE
ncbi:hypothetical protein C8Q78DRAFT_1073761 [Trametes maxima]|nr:hypothetical protein C8Q78DRAFT_1073761 [Trametes maxima]